MSPDTVSHKFGDVPLFVIVIVSVGASVVNVIPVPATKVNVSLKDSATTVVCPATATAPKSFCAPACPPVYSTVKVLPLIEVVIDVPPSIAKTSVARVAV